MRKKAGRRIEMMDSTQGKGLFPPRDFIPTAAIWGFWAAGVMAGLNHMRLGNRKQGGYTIVIAVTAQLIFWFLVYLWSPSQPLIGVTGPQPWDQQINLRACLYVLLLLFVDGAVGYGLYRMQRGAYQRWFAELPRGSRPSPYVEWWVSLLAILGAVAVVLLMYIIFYVGL